MKINQTVDSHDAVTAIGQRTNLYNVKQEARSSKDSASSGVVGSIERAERLARSVKVARFAWSLAGERDGLPELLEDALR